MSRPALALTFALILPLVAGAGPAGDSGTFASREEFVRAVGMKKGLWRTRVMVTSAEIQPSPTPDPARLAEVRAQIESKLGVAELRDECLSADPMGRARLPGIVLEPNCTFTNLRAAGGRWSFSCAVASSVETGNMESEGTYARKAVTGRHEGSLTHNGVAIRLKAETESRYVGKCPA